MQLFFYSILLHASQEDTRADALRTRGRNLTHVGQLRRSLRSLRRHAPGAKIYVFVYGAEPSSVMEDELTSQGAHVIRCGAYAGALEPMCGPLASAFSHYPTLHKWLSAARVADLGASQAVYLDCDTFFNHDPRVAVARHVDRLMFAREEPGSRRCDGGYRPDLLNEDALAALAREGGNTLVAPFNTGLMLFNKGACEAVRGALPQLGQWLARLVAGFDRRAPSAHTFDEVRKAIDELRAAGTPIVPVPYPADRVWIVEQIAAWLALSAVGNVSVGLLPKTEFGQGLEFLHDLDRSIIGYHYFSGNESMFLANCALQEADFRADERTFEQAYLEPGSLVTNPGFRLDLMWTAHQRRKVARSRIDNSAGRRALAHFILGDEQDTIEADADLPWDLVSAAIEEGYLIPEEEEPTPPLYRCECHLELDPRASHSDTDTETELAPTAALRGRAHIERAQLAQRAIAAHTDGSPTWWSLHPVSGALEPYWLNDESLGIVNALAKGILRAGVSSATLASLEGARLLAGKLPASTEVLSPAQIASLSTYLGSALREGLFVARDDSAPVLLDDAIVRHFHRELASWVSVRSGRIAHPQSAMAVVCDDRVGFDIAPASDETSLNIALCISVELAAKVDVVVDHAQDALTPGASALGMALHVQPLAERGASAILVVFRYWLAPHA